MVFAKLSFVAMGFGALGLLGCGGADFDQTAELEPTSAGEETADESQELTATATASKSFFSLGDSIAFGFNPLVPLAPPTNFIGYPEYIASKGHKVTNASCPGETSGSFLYADPVLYPDNGCRGFKAAFALHADYETTQIAYTVATVKALVKAKKSPDYITLNIGANDLFVLQISCNGDVACIQTRLPGVVAAYSANLQNGYNQVKAAGYTKKFIALTTYATNYNDPLAVPALTLMNNALAAFTSANGGKLADGFKVFKDLSAATGGDACAAGLLIKKPDNTCDIHPSELGRKKLAEAVLAKAN